MADELSGLRRGAIVLLSLGEQHATELLRRLPAEEADQLRDEMARVGGLRSVSLRTRQRVLTDFCSASAPPEPDQPDGVPFESLQGAQADGLLKSIRDEHPQTIALVLSHLPADQASDVLAGLDHHKKVEVIKRIAGIEQTSTEVIDEVEQSLRQRLALMMGKTVRAGGISAVAEILNSADRTIEQEILRELDADEPDLADHIRKVQAIFEDLLIAPDHDLRSVIEQLDHETISMALRTARPELREKVLWNLTEEQAELIERESAEPVAVSAIEAAQQRVAEVVHRLDAAGEIQVLARAIRGGR